jgi:hypothetical protein
MTAYLNDGDSVVQILACEQDSQRLCDEISRHVAADRAKHAAVYEARASIDQTRLMAPRTGLRSPQHTPPRSPTKLPSFYLGRSNITLTLLHMDTTFRFNSIRAASSSLGLAWPVIHRSFASCPFVDDDLILRAQYHQSNARFKSGKQRFTFSISWTVLILFFLDVNPGALLLHVEILACAHSDAVLFELAKAFRAIRCLWTRQLLFSQDPARFHKESDGALSVLMQEFDSQHTAGTITACLKDLALCPILDKHGAEISLRLFSLMGKSSQRLKIPMKASDLPIQNSLYDGPSSSESQKDSYFGLRSGAYVHM